MLQEIITIPTTTTEWEDLEVQSVVTLDDLRNADQAFFEEIVEWSRRTGRFIEIKDPFEFAKHFDLYNPSPGYFERQRDWHNFKFISKKNHEIDV